MANELGYVPYQRKTTQAPATSASTTRTTTATGASPSTGLQRPSPSTLSTPVGVGIGLVRPLRSLQAPPPLRSASNLRKQAGEASEKAAGKRPQQQSQPQQQPRPHTSATPSSPAVSSPAKTVPKSDVPTATQPAPPRSGSGNHSRAPSRQEFTNGTASPRSSASSTPKLTNASLSLPAHVHSYAALLAAQSKLGPIPVPQGVAIPNAVGINVQQTSSSLDGRMTSYRPGFQPKGAYRVRTDEFVRVRAKRRGQGEMEEQRMERRLAKLIAIHFAPSRDQAIIASSSKATVDLEELRADPRAAIRRGGSELWRSLRGQDSTKRTLEQTIVKWQDDREASRCPICETSFSLTVRKHHCRLCGRVVCASPQLSKPIWADPLLEPGAKNEEALAAEQRSLWEQKCSTAIVADPETGIIQDAWELQPLTTTPNKEAGEKGVRICKDCKNIIRKRQYMMDKGPPPAYLKLYEALMQVQREIEESLPEFQEMVLGLQKRDQAATLGSSAKANLALQRDAAQARKQLLANFANYDELAKRIRKLPIASGKSGDAAQERLQLAIWTRANQFLQQNMLPLRSLPKKLTTSQNGDDKSVAEEAGGEAEAEEPVDVDALQDQLGVLLEQERLVAEYVESASQARKFDDARTLKKSHDELCQEIMRIQEKLVVRGRGAKAAAAAVPPA